MYFINSGQLDVTIEGKGKVRELGAGDFFGEMALLSADSKRTATVVAACDTHVLRLSRTGFEKVLAQSADFQAYVREKQHQRYLPSESLNPDSLAAPLDAIREANSLPKGDEDGEDEAS